MTLQQFDDWLILAIGVWFIPKGLLFFETWRISKILTPKELRTELGNAYRGIFGGLAPFSIIMGVLFIMRWASDEPVTAEGPTWLQIVFRASLIVLLTGVLIQEVRALRALRERYAEGQRVIHDPTMLPETDLDRCLRELGTQEDRGGIHGDI